MLRILIADCQPASPYDDDPAFADLSNRLLFERALRMHEPAAICTTINLAERETLPTGTSPADFDGVILTGSALHVMDRSPVVLTQIAFARAVFEARVPCWGSCYGLQLTTVALGGEVRVNPNGREIGAARGITLTPAGQQHPLLTGRPAVFDALCSHLDEVQTLPPGAEVLAGNAISAVQAMALRTPFGGTFHGVQYHPELTLSGIALLLELRSAPLAVEGLAQSEATLRDVAEDYRTLSTHPGRRDLAWRYGISEQILNPLLRTQEIGNWLRIAVQGRQALAAE